MVLLCILGYTAVPHGQNTERTQPVPFRQLTPRHSLVELGCPSARGFSVGFPVRTWSRDISGKPQAWASRVAAAWSPPAPVLSLLSQSWGHWPPAECHPPLPPSGWLKRQRKQKGKGTWGTKWLSPVHQLLYHPIQEVAVYQWRTTFQQGTRFIPTCSAGKIWKSVSCDVLKGPQKSRSLH